MTRVQVEESAGLTTREWTRTLPPEMVAEAAKRLGWLGLIYAVSVLIGHFGRRIGLAWSNGLAFEPQVQDAVGVVAMAMPAMGRCWPKVPSAS